MTREEAISELQKAIDLIKQNGKDWLDERDIPILQMAITALELSDSIMLQLDCKMFHSGVNVDNTVSDETTDIIYRQAAIDKLETIGYDFSNSELSEIELEEVCEAVGDVRQDMISMIKRLPSAQFARDICVLCKDTISRQAAIDGKISIQRANGVEIYSDEAVPVEYLKALPSAQPEIIRCEDCIWHSHTSDGDIFCDHPKGLIGWVVPTDFCSKAERKTDGETISE